MIKINSIKLNISQSEETLKSLVAGVLRCRPSDIISLRILKKSLDARKKDNIKYVYSIAAEVIGEAKILSRNRDKNITAYIENKYAVPVLSSDIPNMDHTPRPVIIGFGPAGFTCAYLLSLAGLRPIVIERGSDIDSRTETVNKFWNGTAALNPECNVQFGEGGAGSFSDGKLNTMVHDSFGRIEAFFDILIANGADKSIKYTAKPHIGTDKLKGIVKNIRNTIISNGGEVLFNTKLTDIKFSKDRVSSIILNTGRELECSTLVLAIGHSARDTFEMLYSKNLPMEQKPFAMGVRVQHPQELISRAQYGESFRALPAADYKLTYNAPSGNRSVFSFCMCPGGYVVNASSEPGQLAVNGMSYSSRSGNAANSAIVVNISCNDFPSEDILSGMHLQRELEKHAYNACGGKIPTQYLKDFYTNTETNNFDINSPETKGQTGGSDLNNILPIFMSDAIKEAFYSFDKQINGFKYDYALLMGVESRTSSPIRILRNENMECLSVGGIFPCGEGAGYAGGITSAGVDGIKVYEAIINKIKGEFLHERGNH